MVGVAAGLNEMNTETLNSNYLKSLGICKEGIDFVIRNDLEDFPINRLKDIEGDYGFFKLRLSMTLKNKIEYDSEDRVIKRIDRAGGVTNYQYDSKGNLIKRIDGDGHVIQYEYDEQGNLLKEISEDGIIQYEYDEQGNRTKFISEDGIIQYEYDKQGNLLKEISEDGIIQYKYSDRGYVIEKRLDSSETLTFKYDNKGNQIEAENFPEFIITREFLESDDFLTIKQNDQVICMIPLDYRTK